MCKFKVVMEPCDEGGFVISCPALPGCHSQGETEKEALANIKEAIIGCLEVLNDKALASVRMISSSISKRKNHSITDRVKTIQCESK